MNTETKGSVEYKGFNRTIFIDPSRDSLLTPFSTATLLDRYLWEGETIQTMFARVACVNSDDDAHAQRMYDAISQLHFMPATPVLSNSGHDKNLPISCFLNEVDDSMEGINEIYSENFWLAARGGGIGTNWSNVRGIGEGIGNRGKTSGVVPFIKIQDSYTHGISQGNLRRGSSAAYLDISHPEIAEFIDIRKPEGDFNRRSLNVHHGVIIPDAFMEACMEGKDWDLVSPASGKVVETVNARELFQALVIRRLEVGEPYLWFVDNVNKLAPAVYKQNGLKNTTSNLCSEITLTTGYDYNNQRRTAVCCLSSLNLEMWHEWSEDTNFIEDVMRFLDNVMTHFIRLTNGVKGFENARYAAMHERSVGLGAMGFHGFLQQRNIPFEGVMAKVWNMKIFNHIKTEVDKADIKLGLERGPCIDAARVNLVNRFAHKTAIAPTASISIIAGEVIGPGIEPVVANVYKQKTLGGQFIVKNKWLAKTLELYGKNTDSVWESILENEGSVQHLEFLTDHDKDVYKTAMELNQYWILEHAADRTPLIDQGQSVNLFIPADVDKKYLLGLHRKAWQLGMKGLYYLRSKSLARATTRSHTAGEMPQAVDISAHLEEDTCLSCQ